MTFTSSLSHERIAAFAICSALVALCPQSYGRGEHWVPKPAPPPPVATQVRVCGWNVRWNDIPKTEQDEYILRAERIMR